jgi:hypothetical protein
MSESAVDALVQLVCEHLDHEEVEALPIVERWFTDADWHRYMHTERRKRGGKGAQFLTWVLDDAAPSDAATVLHELPPPAARVPVRVEAPVRRPAALGIPSGRWRGEGTDIIAMMSRARAVSGTVEHSGVSEDVGMMPRLWRRLMSLSSWRRS